MNSNSIIKAFWPLLKLLQVFGGIPIKKSNDTACGFEALSFCQYLVITGFVWLFAIAGNIFAWINIMANHDKSAFELFQILFKLTRQKALLNIIKKRIVREPQWPMTHHP